MKWRSVASVLAWHMLTSSPVWAALIPGSMDVHWDTGRKPCLPADASMPLQVHRYDTHTFVLRENLCATWEAPFMYLLIGSKQALLIDTGDIADPKIVPLESTVMSLLPARLHSRCH